MIPPRVLATVALLGLVVWGLTVPFAYTLDDRGIVYGNTTVERFDLHAMFTAPYRAGSTVEEDPDAEGYLYRPVPLLTFAFDRALFGEHPAGGHLTNVVLHGMFAVLAYAVLRRLRTSVEVAGAAAMFALLHPVHVESVANIKHREEILAAIGVLGAWWLLERGWAATRRRAAWSGIAAVAFLAALLSKESAIVALLVLPLSSVMLFSRSERPWSRIAALHVPLLGALAAWLAMRTAAIGAFATTLGNEVFFVPSEGFITRLLTSAKVWASWYVGRGIFLMSYPTGFSTRTEVLVETGWPSPWAWAGLLLVTASIVGAVVAFRRGRRDVAYWIAFFWIALAPTSNVLIPIGSVGAYRFLYLPSLAWGVLGGFTLAAGIARWGSRDRASKAYWAIVTGLAIVFAIATAIESRNWRNDATLNLADVRRTSNPRARYVEAWAAPDVASRERWLRDAVRIFESVPGSARGTDTTVLAKSYHDLADIALDRGQTSEAEALAKQALDVLETDWRFRRYRAYPLALLARGAERRGDRVAAIARWRESSGAEPVFAVAYRERARLEAEAGSPERAAAVLREGIAALAAANKAWLREDQAALEGMLRDLENSRTER